MMHLAFPTFLLLVLLCVTMQSSLDSERILNFRYILALMTPSPVS